MFFLGVLSVFQLILLPGLLLIRLFPGKRSFLQQAIVIFMLSLLASYVAVFLLTSIGIYLRSVVFVLVALEIGLLIWLWRKSLQKTLRGWVGKTEHYVSTGLHYFADWLTKDFWTAALYFLLGLTALFCIGWLLWIWVANFNTVYQTWDSWASWDRWTVKWAGNRFPGDTWEYPQLIPASLSLAYKFIGTTAVKFFGKSIMPLFALVIGLMLFDLGKKFKSFGYMLGSGLAIYSINLFLGKYLPEAYVDIPVACFSLMAIYILLSAQPLRDKKEIISMLLLGSLATAAAAVTKQTGLYILAFYPIFAYFWILKGNKNFKGREAFQLLGRHLILALVLVLPWYVFMEYRIVFGGASSNIQYVITDIYQGQTLPERFVTAVGSLDNYVYLYVFALLSVFVLDHRFRQILLILVSPFSILWALFLSYEARNLAIALPMLSMTAGVAVEEWFLRSRALVGRLELKLPAFLLLLLGVIAVGAATFVLDDEVITQRQISQQRQIFEPALNDKLYKYFSYAEGPEPVITSYPIDWLPGLAGLGINERFEEYASFQETLADHPTVELLLVSVSANQQILDEILQKIEEGIYQRIFTEANYILIRIPPR